MFSFIRSEAPHPPITPTGEVNECEAIDRYLGQLPPDAVAQVGRLVLVDQLSPSPKTANTPPRQHYVLRTDPRSADPNGDGVHSHVLCITPSVPSDAEPLTIVTKPGLMETIKDRGIGTQFHKELAKRYPEATIVTHATQGVGPNCEPINPWDLPKYGLGIMANEGLQLLLAHFAKDPKVLAGVSMGTYLNHKLLLRNQQSDQPLEGIKGVINCAPALVDPRNIGPDIGVRLMPSMTLEILDKLLLHRGSPQEVLGRLALLQAALPSIRDLPAISRQAFDIFCGVPEAEISQVASYHPTTVIVGEHDPIGQVPMWRRLVEQSRSQDPSRPPMTLTVVKNTGHGLAADPPEMARLIAAGATELVGGPQVA